MHEDVEVLLFSSALGFFIGSIIKGYQVPLDSLGMLAFDTREFVPITQMMIIPSIF